MNELAGGSHVGNPFGFTLGTQPQQAPQPQGPASPEEMVALRQRTPFGHPSFSASRPMPGQRSTMINPATGRQFSYAEWMQTFMPEAFAGSMMGRQQPQQAQFAPSTMPMMPMRQGG